MHKSYIALMFPHRVKGQLSKKGVYFLQKCLFPSSFFDPQNTAWNSKQSKPAAARTQL